MKIKGKDLTVFVELGGVMTAVALSTGCELDVDREMVEVAGADDWRHYLPRLKGWKITTEQLMSDRSDVQGLIDGQAVKVCFGVQDGIQWCGMALVNRMTLTGQNGAMARYSVSMQGTGALAEMGTAAGWDNAEAWNDAEAWPRGAAAAAGSTTVVTLINDPATHGDVLDAVNDNLQAIDDAFVADRKRLAEIESTRWPDVRFAGVLDGSENVTVAGIPDVSDGSNIWWSTTQGQFLALKNGKYYTEWGNTDTWNSGSTGRKNVYYIADSGIYLMRNGALVLMSGAGGGGGLPGEAWPTAGFGGESGEVPELVETALGEPNERDVYYMTRNRVFAWLTGGKYYVNFATTTAWNVSNDGTLEAKEKAYFVNVRTGAQYWYDGSGLQATGAGGGGSTGDAWQTVEFAKILDGTENIENFGAGEMLTAEDVFYSPKQGAFVGRVFDGLVPKYHGDWGNDELWNENITGAKPRKNVYFVASNGTQYIYDGEFKPTGAGGGSGTSTDRPATSTQMGYKVLKTGTELTSQITAANTIYEVRSDFNLKEGTIKMPENCILKFEGGKIKNGTITGNKTKIDAGIVQIFENITNDGNYEIEKCYAEWFGAKTLSNKTDNDAVTPICLFPPAELDSLPDASEAINKALNLSIISGGYCCVLGKIYKIENTVVFPEKASMTTEKETIIFACMEGDGLKVTTQHEDQSNIGNSKAFTDETLESSVRILLPNQYIHTDSMAKAIELNSTYSNITGGGTLSLVKAKYTIGIFVPGYGFKSMDMTFMSPNIDLVVAGGKGDYTIPDSDSLQGEGEPTILTEKDNTTYWDKTNEYLYIYHSSKWNKSKSTNCEYNTSLRVEITVGWNSGRIINPRITLRDSFGFRGIEICTRTGGWCNVGIWDGTISYKSGSFLSIFTNNDVSQHDFSRIQMQYGPGLTGHDTRMVFAIRCNGCKFPSSWDVSISGDRRLRTMWELGAHTAQNEILIDNIKYFQDRGSKNVVNKRTKERELLLTTVIDTERFVNIWKFRTPSNYLSGGEETTDRIFLWNSEHTFEETLENNTADSKLKYPNSLSDESFLTSLDVLDNEKSFAYFNLGSQSKNLGACYISIEYSFVGSNGYAINDCEAELFHETTTYKLKNIVEGTESGAVPLRNRLVIKIPVSGKSFANFNFKIRKIALANDAAKLRVYNIKIFVDKFSNRGACKELYYGNTTNRPNASPKGFIYFDTTIGSSVTNNGDSSNADWINETVDIDGKADVIAIENVSGTSVTKQIEPNKFYIFGQVTNLTITLGAVKPNIFNEYMFQFISGTTPTVLNLPESIKWIGEKSIEASKTYQVSIVNNIAVMGGA